MATQLLSRTWTDRWIAALVILLLTASGLAQQQLISNGGFESGAIDQGWVASGPVIGHIQQAHGGLYYAVLGAQNDLDGTTIPHDTLYQTLSVPTGTASLLLQFWWNVTTEETSTTSSFDRLTVTLRNSSNQVLTTLSAPSGRAYWSNLDGNCCTTTYSSSGTYNISAYIAQSPLRIHFEASTDHTMITTFRIDDVSVTATTSTGACCVGGSTCTTGVTSQQCSSQGGVWQSGSSTCSNCVAPTLGACCFSGGTCSPAITSNSCASQGGTWQGVGTVCGNCPQPFGTCCAASGACSQSTHALCVGVWAPNGTCSPNCCPGASNAAYIIVPIHGQLFEALWNSDPLARPQWLNRVWNDLHSTFDANPPHPCGNGTVTLTRVFGDWMDGTRNGFRKVVASRVMYWGEGSLGLAALPVARAAAAALEDSGRAATSAASRHAAANIAGNVKRAIANARAGSTIPVFIDLVGHSRGGAVAAQVIRQLQTENTSSTPVYFSLILLDGIDPTGGGTHQVFESAGDLLGDPVIGAGLPNGRSSSFVAENACCGVFPPNIETFIRNHFQRATDATLVSVGYPHGRERTVSQSQQLSHQVVPGTNHVTISDAFAATAAGPYTTAAPAEFSLAFSTRIGQLLRSPTQPLPPLLSERCSGCPFTPRDPPPTEYVTDSTFLLACQTVASVQAAIANAEIAAMLGPQLDPFPAFLNSIATTGWVSDSAWQRTTGTAACSAGMAVLPAGETISQDLDPASLGQTQLRVRVNGTIDAGGTATIAIAGDGFAFSQPIVPGAGGSFAVEQIITRVGQASTGAFDRVSMSGGRVHVTLISVGPPPGGVWTVINLHPTGARNSYALGVRGGQQVGSIDDGATGDSRASVWTGTAASWINLHPGTGYRGSEAVAVDNGQQVGTASAILNGTTQPAQAFLWSGTASSGISLRPSGAVIRSQASGVRAGKQVGSFHLSSGDRAALWSGSAGSIVDLTPPGTTDTSILRTNGSQHFGFVGGVPTLWTGSVPTPLSLPTDAVVRDADIDAGVQVGSKHVVFNQPFAVQIRAYLWRGTTASGVDLHPPGGDLPGQNADGYGSEAWGASGRRQVGYARFAGVNHAGIWNGTGASWVDLHARLPSTFTASFASAVSVEGGATYVVGYGDNAATGRTEALMWVGPPAPPCSADFNGDSILSVQDIFDFLGAWFAGSSSADFNGNGLSVQDIFDFLSAWFTGC